MPNRSSPRPSTRIPERSPPHLPISRRPWPVPEVEAPIGRKACDGSWTHTGDDGKGRPASPQPAWNWKGDKDKTHIGGGDKGRPWPWV